MQLAYLLLKKIILHLRLCFFKLKKFKLSNAE